MTTRLIEEAVAAGARLSEACATAGISARTLQRWRAGPGEDMRCGPHTEPANKLSAAERQHVLDVANSPTFRELSPKQIVPRLADEGKYIAAESTIYRVLREAGQLAHRGPTKAPVRHRPIPYVATGPNQVWSWDITYLKAPVAGTFFYLYLVTDVWSRKIVGLSVHDRECNELAAALIESACKVEGIEPGNLVLHSDNGGPMKGATMLTTLQRLGVVASFSRPSVSNDNPYSEALFRTMKYRPVYPRGPFASLDSARQWAIGFVLWYNTEHLHSGICFVTPMDRHCGRDPEILRKRDLVYQAARRRRPARWSGSTRDWTPVGEVYLNPERHAPISDPIMLQAA